MGTTADRLNKLKNTKQAIKQAIINKGVAVDEAATFASYASKIGEITTGGGSASQIPIIKCHETKKFSKVYGLEWLTSQIKEIDWTEFNKLGITNFERMFNEWKGTILDVSNLDTSNVTTMFYMFNKCKNVKTLDLTNFNTSKVTNMGGMFYFCESLKDLDVSKLDTSHVTNMANMFGCVRYPGNMPSNVYKLDVSQVTNMSGMFGGCNSANNFNFTGWDTSNVTDMSEMFQAISTTMKSIDISMFNTDKVKNFDGIFEACDQLKTIIWPSNFGACPELTTFYLNLKMWGNDTLYLQKESVIDLLNKLASRDNAPTLQIPLNMYDKLTPEEIAIATNKGWTVVRK